MMMESALRSYKQEDRYRLSGLTRHATERGETVELTTTSAPDLLAKHAAVDPLDQADLILDYLDAHSSPGGEPVPLSKERDYTVAQAQGPKGLQFIVNDLQTQGLIERTDKSALPHYRLTMAGYERVKKRRKTLSLRTSRPGWDKVDRHLAAAAERLKDARFEEEFQQVGLLCRETLISLAQALFDPQRHPTLDSIAASPTDAKRMLEAVMAASLSGESNEEARSMAKAAVRLALALQHDRAADRRMATIGYEATAAVVRLASALLLTSD
jgi:hypothetical protein